MIPPDKAVFLRQLIISSKKTLALLEQALDKGDKKRAEELKANLIDLDKAIKKSLTELKIKQNK